jgi:hypothetical protein
VGSKPGQQVWALDGFSPPFLLAAFVASVFLRSAPLMRFRLLAVLLLAFVVVAFGDAFFDGDIQGLRHEDSAELALKLG